METFSEEVEMIQGPFWRFFWGPGPFINDECVDIYSILYVIVDFSVSIE